MLKSGIKNYLREQIAFLVMIALLFGSFFSAFTVSHQQVLSLKSLEQQVSMFGEKVLICTADGYEWKTWKEIAQEKNSANPHDSAKCKFCQAGYSSKDSAIPLDIAVINHWSIKLRQQSAYKAEVNNFVLAHAPPRSPPQFS